MRRPTSHLAAGHPAANIFLMYSDESLVRSLSFASVARRLLSTLILPLLVSGSSPLHAQAASLNGRVIDASGLPIAASEVSVTSVGTGVVQKTLSSSEGHYLFPFLAAGEYTLTASARGFRFFERRRVRIETAQNATVQIELEIGEVNQTVTVDGGGILINTTDAAVSTVVDRQFVENIPLNGRSLQSLLSLVPGTVVVPSSGTGYGEISVNGQRTEANYFTVDGVSANTGSSVTASGAGGGTAGSTPGQTALGTTQSMVSLEALQEFRAVTSSYSAEYGRTPGGQFSFTTRSGGNDWHGSLFEYFRNDKLDANNWFNNANRSPRPAQRQNDFGGSLGGPVRIPGLYDGRDKTFFFASMEALRLRTPQPAVVMEVPSLALRKAAPPALQPFLNSFPLPNGPSLGNELDSFTQAYSNPSMVNAPSIRLDHYFTPGFRVFGRYSDTPSESQSRSAGNRALVNANKNTVKTATIGVTNIWNARLSSDLRLNVTGNDGSYRAAADNFGGATPLVLSSVPGIGDSASNWFTFGLSYGANMPNTAISPTAVRQRQFNITENISYAIGRHNFKAGLDYRRLWTSQFVPNFVAYSYFYSPLQVINNSAEMVYGYRYLYAARPVYKNFSAYLQDEWKVTPRLNLSLGIRWDVNPAPTDNRGNNPYTITTMDLARTEVAPRGTPLWKTTWRNFAPRFGLAYQLRQSNNYQTVLRTGAGLFFDMGNNQASQGYNGFGNYNLATWYNVAFPLTAAQLESIPQPTTAPPYTTVINAFDPDLKLPYTWQWNVSIEQGLGASQSLTVNYIGSSARNLLTQQRHYPAAMGNTNFTAASTVALTTNLASSDYNALQVQFQRRLSHGLQFLASYSWSHVLDNASSNFLISQLRRANASFDVRQNFQAAATYAIPGKWRTPVAAALLNNWFLDSRITARSGLPVNVIGAYGIDPVSGTYLTFQPDYVAGQPLYISDPYAPGGRKINFNAFKAAPTGVDGNLGRNVARGFSAVQGDLAIRREFHLSERLHLQFRGEAFNLFNNAVFGSIYNTMSTGAQRFGVAYSTLNGQLGGLNALYQIGGPRSIELATRVTF